MHAYTLLISQEHSTSAKPWLALPDAQVLRNFLAWQPSSCGRGLTPQRCYKQRAPPTAVLEHDNHCFCKDHFTWCVHQHRLVAERLYSCVTAPSLVLSQRSSEKRWPMSERDNEAELLPSLCFYRMSMTGPSYNAHSCVARVQPCSTEARWYCNDSDVLEPGTS